MTTRRLLVLAVLSLCLPAGAGTQIGGRVVGVHDGDTLTLLTSSNQQLKVRLHGIDAPETGQAFGDRAKQALSAYTFGRTVTVDVLSRDKYGRAIGVVYAAMPVGQTGSFNVNQAMVQYGYAWWYQEYAKNSPELAKLEQQARAAKAGLWSQPGSVAPWRFRGSGAKPSVAQKVTSAISAVNAFTRPAPIATGYVYVTRSGKRFHTKTCKEARSASAVLRSEASRRGYTPCQVCRP